MMCVELGPRTRKRVLQMTSAHHRDVMNLDRTKFMTFQRTILCSLILGLKDTTLLAKQLNGVQLRAPRCLAGQKRS